jgi:4,5-dihydroxyphthalate decarboxylase
MNITLSMAIASNPRTWPILDGTVKPDGIDLVPTVLFPSEMFWRQLRYAEFDISEMSLSSLMIIKPRVVSFIRKSWFARIRVSGLPRI